MASSSNTDILYEQQEQECKCYKVLSSKPLTNKRQVFDCMASFLRKDKERQLQQQQQQHSNSNDDDDDDDDDDDGDEAEEEYNNDDIDPGSNSSSNPLWGQDLVREKASWNELRRWANELLTECSAGSDESNDDGGGDRRIPSAKNKRRQVPISEWKQNKRPRLQSVDDDDEVMEDGGYEESHIKMEHDHDDNGKRLKGMIKAKTIESTGRAEVAIAGRSADESFEDHLQSDMDDIEEARKEMETKEMKKARKKAKKEAKKKAKKEAKKKAKKEKK